MTTTNDVAEFPIIDRTTGSETTRPDIAIAATPAGRESVYVGTLYSNGGDTMHLRVARQGFRVLFKNDSNGEWHCARSMHCNLRGIDLGTSAVALTAEVAPKLEGLGFELDDASVDFLDTLPAKAPAVYTAARQQRSVVPAAYLPATVQALREYTDGASKFRGY